MISVTLIGSGNVGTHLFKAFSKAEDTTVNQWYSRDSKAIQVYKKDTEIIDSLSQLKKADVYIIAVSDDAINDLSTQLPFENRLVVHTSGSANLKALDMKLRRGVFYPLQTFSKDVELDFSKVPFCLEVMQKKDLNLLKALAKAIGSPFYKIDTEQRQSLHLAAVFVNNFTNQLYRIAHEISDNKHIEFDILKPLIQETAHKIQNLSPYLAQTGPAIRHDKKTIKHHLKQLENDQHKAIYELLTKSIQKTHGR